MPRGVAIAVALMFGAACDELTSELQPDVEDVPPRDIVYVTSGAGGGVVATGAQSGVVMSARLPLKATAPTVKFETSGGYFVETGTKSVVVRAVKDVGDTTHLYARTLLRSDSSVVAVVRASLTTLADRYDTVSVRFVRP